MKFRLIDKVFIFAFGWVLFLGMDLTLTAASPASGISIQRIEFKGLKKIEKEALLSRMKSRSGQVVSESTIAEDIRSIHALGYFDEIAVYEENSVLMIEVKERPTITSIQFEGNEQISESDLKEVIKLKEYALLDINKVKDDVAALQKKYEEKGFSLARVSYELRPSDRKDSQEVSLVFKIQDYQKLKIKKIQFIGNHVFSDQQLKSTLRDTKEEGPGNLLSSSGIYREAALKQDLQILTLFYLNHGYLDFRYENPVVTVSDDKKWMTLSIYVEEGQAFRVGQTDFQGDLLFSKEELEKSLSLKSGDVFSIESRNNDIDALTQKYQDLGYAFVNVNPKINKHDDSLTADIVYEFEKGEVAYFGTISIAGNTKTRDKVIRRELRIYEGERFHGTHLRQSRERVERLGYFAQNEVVFNTVPRKDKSSIVDVEISIKERSTGTFSLGMGYGSVQRFFLQSQIAEINLFGRGQSITLMGQYSATRQSRNLDLSFTEPYTFDTLWSSGGNLFYTTYPIPDRYLLYKKGAHFRLGHPINDEMTAYGTYKIEEMSLGDVTSNTIDYGLDVGLLSSVNFALTRDLRNNRFETSAGDYESFSVEYAGLGGSKHFVKYGANARYYKPLLDFTVLRTNLEMGHMMKVSQRELPPSEKYFLGGPNSLKGYNLVSVGPRDSNNIPQGGTSHWTYNLEFEFPLIREAGLKFVTFFDAGNAYASWHDFIRFADLKKDYGFGFRWFSPLGPLRFEWGFPIHAQSHEDSMVFNFFIGQPF